jgi:Sigma-70, region 4
VTSSLVARAAARGTLGSCREPGHVIRDGADAGEPIAAAVWVMGPEWWRRWQRGRPVSSALGDQSGLPLAGARRHEADLLRELHEHGSPQSWLYTAARNIGIDAWRTRRPETVTDRLSEQPVGDAAGQVVNRHLVAAALRRLSQEHRDVLRECYLRGSSVAQAAQALGIAPGTVKSRTYYALRALRLAIEELRGAE